MDGGASSSGPTDGRKVRIRSFDGVYIGSIDSDKKAHGLGTKVRSVILWNIVVKIAPSS